jgi:diketogulonate reductase-like aldo/keto reductase
MMKIGSITEAAALANGVAMPWLGLGVAEISDGDPVRRALGWALEAGYRSVDTAGAYGNERGVGEAIRQSGLPREEVFVTTKVRNSDQRAGRVLEGFESSLDRLGMDTVDLYLIHWPVPDRYVETWQVLERIYRSGRARAIGVSNFLVHHLEDLLAKAEIVPMVNQVEFHPWLQSPPLQAYCRERNIQLEAYSPLLRGRLGQVKALGVIGQKYGKTPAQVALRWILQKGVVAIPKSVHRERIRENAALFDFELAEADMAAIDRLDRGYRTGGDPDNFYF